MTGAAVVDASVALKWVLPEDGSRAAARLADSALHAPELLTIECGNALWVRVRRGELSRAEARACFDELARAPVSLVRTSELAAPAFALSLELDQTVYDCVYLAHAIRLGVPLVTADRRLHRAVAERPEFGDVVVLLGAPA